MEKKSIEISWNSLWRILIVVAIGAVFFVARQVFFILFLAIVLASAIEPIVNFLEKRRIPRVFSVLMIFIIGLAILALLLYTVIPIALIEFKEFSKKASGQDLGFLSFLGLPQISDFNQQTTKIIDTLLGGTEPIINFITSFFGNVFLVIVAFVLTFYFAAKKRAVEDFLRVILPSNYEDYIIGIYQRSREKLGRWFFSQVLLAIIIGSLCFLGLRLLGIKYALLLAILAVVLDLLPVIGPIIAGIVAFVVALSQSWLLAIYVAIIFFVVQQIENGILRPWLAKEVMHVNPVVVIIALLVGYAVAGFLGAVLAVPAAVFLQELIDDWAERKAKTREA